MALVIEDGSIVSGANSFITVAELRTFANQRGVELPTEDGDLEPIIVQAADYINSYEPKFKGARVNYDQPMAWPRSGVKVYGAEVAETVIPAQLKASQAQASILVVNGVDLMPNITNYAIRRQKVDVLEVEYAAGGGQNNAATPEIVPKFPTVEALIKPLLEDDPFGFLKVSRA